MDPVCADGSRRPSLVRDRPCRPPLPNGPRTVRSVPKNSLDTSTPPGGSIEGGSPVGSGLTSPSFTSPLLRPGSPVLLEEANTFSLDASLPHRVSPFHTSLPLRSDASVQVSPDFISLSSAPAEQSRPALKTKTSIATFLAPPPLVPPPEISFESLPIPWKGLPYEAAQWTFTSEELQEIVSRAIRLSAKESFIRLLSLQALDTDMIKESERLEEERSAAQVKWRFEMNRRTMLMQALNASASILASSSEGDKDNVLGSLIPQVAASIASCDSILASVLQMSDQQSQISIVQHRHWASALGIALRKLNKAFERQGEEMKRALIRIQTLEDELEEAWREAEGMAAEIDEMENSDEEDVDDVDDNQTLGGITLNTDLGQVMGVTSKAVLSKATLITKVNHIASDTKSVKSFKSSRSRRSNKDGPSRSSRLSAAKTRSRTASNASLRLPKALRTPTTQAQALPDDPPPIPALPDNLQCYSFLDMDSGGTEYNRPPRKQLPNRAPEPKASLPNLPEPPHTAGLPQTMIPSIWVDAESGSNMRSNGLDRSHSMQIFPALRHGRRSELVMSLSRADSSNSHIENGEAALGVPAGAVGDSQLPVSDRRVPVPLIDRPASAVDRLVSGAMDKPRQTVDHRRSSGSYMLLPLFSERSSGIPATVLSGGRYYSPSGLPSYRSAEPISECGSPSRVGTPNTE